MQFNYRNRNLVVINGDVYIYKNGKSKFEQPFFSFQAEHIFIGKSEVCELTEFSGAEDKDGFDGITVLLECKDNENLYIFG